MNLIKRVIIFLTLLVTLVLPCSNPFKLVYTNGNALAVQQESLLVKYNKGEIISKDTLRDLKVNWWVRSAEKVAPGNLVIRQYCLIDLFEGKANHKKEIERLVYLLSGGISPYKYRTWAESYSYWLYTKEALFPWMNKFDKGMDSLTVMANDIDNGFAYTANRRYSEGKFYPAPFGDLWEVPLDSLGQVKADSFCMLGETAELLNVKRFYDRFTLSYEIYAMPMGLNGHCEASCHLYRIENEKPTGFKYYQGYSEKYKDVKAEWTDLLNPIRLLTIPFIW
jgi:hypothetical protein